MVGASSRSMAQTIEIPVPDELLRLVDERAQNAGLPREAYIRAVLVSAVSARPSVDEILAPFRRQVADSGVSNEELDRLFSEARDEYHREQGMRPADEQ